MHGGHDGGHHAVHGAVHHQAYAHHLPGAHGLTAADVEAIDATRRPSAFTRFWSFVRRRPRAR